MTRIFTDGAEFGDGYFFELGGVLVTTSYVRSGNYAYGSQTASGHDPTKLLPMDMSDFYLRFGSYGTNVGDHHFHIAEFRHGDTVVAEVQLNDSGKLSFYVGTNLVVTGTFPFLNHTWNLLDMHIEIGVSGHLELKMNGVLDMYYNGDTRGGGLAHIDRIYWGSGSTLGHYPHMYFDDIALNDTTGLVDNFWCGDGHVELLRPDANGDTSEWVGSDGNSIDNYQMVDEIPNDGDTTYVGTALSNKTDTYNLSSFNDANKIVRRIYAEARARDLSAVGQNLKLGYKSDGTVALCEDDRILTYGYSRVVGDEILNNPATGQPWTKSELDAIQFAVKNGSILG